jgi:hypothetical protein
MRDQLHLLFAVEDPSADVAPSIASLVRGLNEGREWSCGEIAFVNEIVEISAVGPSPTRSSTQYRTWGPRWIASAVRRCLENSSIAARAEGRTAPVG